MTSKTGLLLIILVLVQKLLVSQVCVTTNSLLLNTGFNKVSNTVIPQGSPDSTWTINNANNIPGAINGNPSMVCVPNGGAASYINSRWIGFATSSQYVTNNPTVGFYLITFKYTFRTCLQDSLNFVMSIANDNYISEIRIDGIPTGFSQPVSLVTTNWTTFANFQYAGLYPVGTHTIEVDVQNFNVAQAMNPHGLNLYGSINSMNQSLVAFNSPNNCTCNAVMPDSINANFSYAFPNPCDSTVVQFTDATVVQNSNIVSWNWDFGDGNTSLLQNPTHNYLLPGGYNVTLIATNNLNKSDTVQYLVQVVNNLPVITAVAVPPAVCPGGSSVLSGSGGVSYSWSGGISNGVPFSPSSTTTFTVTGTDANGCTNTAPVTVTVLPSPQVSASANPTIICPGAGCILAGSGANSYSWSGGVTNGVQIYPTNTSTYTVTGTDANGCTGTSTVTVQVLNNLPVSIMPLDPLLCLGDSLQLTASGAQNFNWNATPGLSAYTGSTVWAFPVNTTVYSVTGTDANGCSGSATVTVEVVDQIRVLAGKNRDAECGQNLVQLSATGAQNYTWTPATGLSNPNAALTNAQVIQTTTYYVTGTTGSCSATDSVTVYLFNNEENSLYIPNAFTPNGDGNNDCLRVRHQARFTKYYFALYNRWGEKVFEADNPDACWYGEHKSHPAALDTYYYYLEAESSCGKVFRKGDVVLIR
jgi:gliding motility-associated-like protein